MSSMPHYVIPIQTKLDNLYRISQSKHVTVFTDGLDLLSNYSEVISCLQVLLQIGDREFYLVTAEQTEINYNAEIDHLVIVKEKEIPKLYSFNPKEKPEFIKIKDMQSPNGFKLITFLEENYYCKANSNTLHFTFEAGIAILLEGEHEKLLISFGRTPQELIITSNTDDIARILLEKELKPYTLEVKSII
ncbi:MULTISPECIES: hypothetical protein [Anoxybacillaceae]|jgi:hypothetical protein|uniref:hypothetical protein n=1 Tax=Anoxybacillaceae TaxID=3120669 RepID=UPI000B926E07|nr:MULTISPECIES: hypothetical protein [Bacillaceae]ASS88252.1 hypothetical protein GLN3_15270 [Geobacillus lituanicus]WJQ01179.1 hypothetical protein QT234_04860 [Geobacillus stearothermophilus]WJQ04590.1 hypothetical protein QT236_04820 [Geobacillus stearothermophilus]WJQ08065.1 hypothetical protein QT235_05500 [Geobacillus stearothermophilus]WJQ11535.1 hypothetical protein QT237_05255 [Geobacillus stearothermophilus]